MGGSFYIQQSESVLVRICIFFSYAQHGCGYYIQTVEYSTNKNYAFECSVSECNGFDASIYHQYGEIKVSNMNTSYNRINMHAAYVIDTQLGSVNFTTVSNSSSSHLDLTYSESYIIFTKCNHLNNEYTGIENAIFYCWGTIRYLNCSFIRNVGNYLFFSKPDITHCYFDKNEFTRTVNQVYTGSFDSIEPLNSFISHYAVEGCPRAYNYNNNSYNDDEDELDLEDIKNILSSVYNTSFFEAVNLL
ncbi:hypothetical protein TVAG_404180 [Trichomonas vaginalis G3]|uniref:Right handed beta helix domain-containing protein n=1 Tax=Trichomonas vaginalis (strain ATCC PRA-98 / G3) TaxID=412133 RepID=A2EGG7_TRIV3|nr:hypothetical protein TVAGG3_0675580 [Trichomonas vaginalis G3]EAY08250.1 hypothetical protein TVAG_404180 [Trichomonas vaginalis G3]KAI5507512.1 hypothetical protein TVAGG3_0675580 [Trichomonas vaginalis G3]|eukprot:XP_001320473.1 hypothetical protein [Trichomonas vaginalis G3]